LVHGVNVLKLAELVRGAVGVVRGGLVCKVNVLDGMRRCIHPKTIDSVFQPESEYVLNEKQRL